MHRQIRQKSTELSAIAMSMQVAKKMANSECPMIAFTCDESLSVSKANGSNVLGQPVQRSLVVLEGDALNGKVPHPSP